MSNHPMAQTQPHPSSRLLASIPASNPDEGLMPTQSTNRDPKLAYLLLRVLLGLNIAIHGISRILTGPGNFASSLLPEFQKTILPAWSVYQFGLVLPFAEALFGVLLLIGLATRIALIGGSLLMIALTFGTTLRQDWNTASTQLIYGALYAALLAFCSQNDYSLDILLFRHPKKISGFDAR
jgi:thiosulfate dehydrogenase (quinone) large subunit